MATEEELFANIDALLEEEPQLPPPAERARLREAAGTTQARLAQALKTTTQTVKNYENGRTEPKSPRLEAYQRLLNAWAAKYPVHGTSAPAPSSQPELVPQPFTGPSAPEAPAAVEDPAGQAAPERPARPVASSRRSAVKKAAKSAVDPRFPHGPLAVLDGDGSAYGVDGIVLDCPARTVPELVEWTLRESGLGAPRLHKNGKDSDPLIVLTAAAAVKLGLPERLEGHEQRRSLRLPEDPPGRQAGGEGEVEAHAARVRPVGADLPQGAGKPAAVRAARDPVLGRPRFPVLARRRGDGAGRRRPRPGGVRPAGHHPARVDGRVRAGVDDGAAPAHTRRTG
jgi:transcriptional regulator with XRE-family HTH domain